MIACKHCGHGESVKNGIVRGKQRYRCGLCGCNFTEGDGRVDPNLAAKRALAVILYSVAKTSFNMLGHIFGVSRSLTYRWIKQEADGLPMPEVPGDIQEMEFDEMWHFIGEKNRKSGSSRRWIVCRGELSPGFSVVVMLQPSGGSMPKSSI